MSTLFPTMSEGLHFWHIAAASLTFALLFPSVSFLINRRLCVGTLKRYVPGIAQLAALVFLLAIADRHGERSEGD